MSQNGHCEADEEKTVDKHNWGAADLEKVTDYQEDKDDVAANDVAHLKAEAPEAIQLHADDLTFLLKELELRRPLAERLLVKARGDLQTAISLFITENTI